MHAAFLLKRLLTAALSVIAVCAGAQGIRGTVTDDTGQPLAFATIFVKQLGTGTTTNEDGFYEVALDSGRYDVVYQFLGYETQVRVALVGNAPLTFDVALKPQATVLPTVVVQDGDEDPAYTIMRKAIAKAKYHSQQLDGYSARVYIKGAGKLKDYPWVAKGALKKEGIEKGRVYISESISEIKYTRPRKFEEKVISIRSDGKDNNTSPNQYIFGSFYEPEIAETVSPLSPRAFSYYRFEYLGTFQDRDYAISKIKVTPRVKGDNVVDGVISIVEDWWSIHSMDIHTTKLGINIFIKAMYAPIEDKAWLPVSHQFRIDGKVFGFEFEYKYLATVSDYKIKLNPALYLDGGQMEVIDEKVQRAEAKAVEKQRAAAKTQPPGELERIQERLTENQEITRKELRKMMNAYDKQDRKKQEAPEVLSDVTFTIDSLAFRKDSAYWHVMRPVPLTPEEVTGYRKSDSLAVIDRKKEAGDTVKTSKHQGFQPWDLLIGDNYKLSPRSNFKIHFPMPGFNTVEGWNLVYKVSFGTILPDTNKTRLTLTPAFRYAFAREVASGNLKMSLRNKTSRFEIEGGRYVKQYNPDEPILPIVNDFMTLLAEKNLMKLYERRYVDMRYSRRLNPFVGVTATVSWARRHELENNTNYKWVDVKSIEGYTPNRPVNAALSDTSFPDHEAFIASVGVAARPWLKYRVRNGEKMPIDDSSPTFTLDYRKGLSGVLASDVDFDQLELGIRHAIDIGVRGRLNVALRGGTFLNTRRLYFMDYEHFAGNRTPFITNDPVGSFRLLDYYAYSTADAYFSGSAFYQFRRFLITSFPLARMMGLRENIFVNYLATDHSQNYTELGYSIDGILRIFRIEAAAAFQHGAYKDYGFRIGVASYFTLRFSDN